MERIPVVDAQRDFPHLVTRVCREGVSVDVVQGERVVARISPVPRSLTVGELQSFLQSLPDHGDDAQKFAEDLQAIRRGAPLAYSRQ